jgi:hypothetical protein
MNSGTSDDRTVGKVATMTAAAQELWATATYRHHGERSGHSRRREDRIAGDRDPGKRSTRRRPWLFAFPALEVNMERGLPRRVRPGFLSLLSGSRGNVVMHRAVAILLVLIVVVASGCASTSPPQPTARPFENLRQLVVVASGDTTFAVTQHSAEPGRTFDEILKWGSFGGWWWKPAADLAHRGINWLLQLNRKSDVSAGLGDVSPREMVATAFASTLRASGQYDEITTLTAEPSGDDRRSTDAIVRLAVPAWGLVRVREGEPDLHSAFADVRAEVVLRGTGVVVWKRSEDVTDFERVPLATFSADRNFTRQQLIDVLERGGQRLASELLYARSAGR